MTDTAGTGEFDGRVALVTGAAKGMGAAEARGFAALGASVVVTDIDADGGETVAHEIGDQAIFLKHDVSDPSSWELALRQARGMFGRIDVLVNNAGGGATFKALVDTSPEEWARAFQLNVHAAFFGCRAVHPYLCAVGGGSIVNIGSNLALRALVGNSAYSCAKAGLSHLTRLAAVEFAPDRIRVNTVHPGITRTPLSEQQFADPEFVKAIVDPIPMKRPAVPDDIAAAVLFLASPAASYITGAEVTVDGAQTVRY